MGEFSSLPLNILSLGRRDYVEVWELQRKLQRALLDGEGTQTLILCEHNPVITYGKSSDRNNILLSKAELATRGVQVHEIERGGDVTYHGPGQLVGYPILDLRTRRRDVGWYMRSLEDVIVQTLQQFGIDGVTEDGRTGVWTRPSDFDKTLKLQKIASIGVRLSRWCTLHGFSLNVFDCRDGFSLINPCGFKDIETSSIERLAYSAAKDRSSDQVASTVVGKELSLGEVTNILVPIFCDKFAFQPSQQVMHEDLELESLPI